MTKLRNFCELLNRNYAMSRKVKGVREANSVYGIL